ncbi:MAG: energy transducer TonB [Proteobacteria bacterium]|nr:energy transducer TonB [Pseudomonadota bacterium]
MQISSKKRQKVVSFCAAFLLHFALLFGIYFSFSKTNPQPEIALEVELISPGELTQKKKTAEIINLKKETHDEADHRHAKDDKASGHITKNLEPIFHPLPAIPDDLRDEAFLSHALARFHIDSDGNVTRVELLQPCANPRLNSLLVKALQKWKFSAGTSSRTQEINVTFSVQ